MTLAGWPLRLALLVGLALVAVAPALVAYRTSPFVPLLLAAAVGFGVLSCAAPGWAVPAACLLAPLEAIQLPVGGAGALSATEAAFLVVALGWVWRALSRPDDVVFPGISDFPTLAFVLALLPGAAIGAEVPVVGKLLVMWSAFFLVLLTVRAFSPHEVRRVLWALGIGAGILGLSGVLAYVGGGGATISQGGTAVSGRASGGIDDPNYYAAYLVLGAVPLLGMLVGRLLRRRVLAAVAVSLSMLGIVLSLSRGGFVALAVAVCIVAVSWSRARWVSVAAISLAVVTTLANLNPLLSGEATEVVAQRLRSSTILESSNNKRLLLWSEALGVIDEHKAFGVGALQWEEHANRLNLTQHGAPLKNVHNIPLNIAVELGLVGLLAWLLWLVRIGRDLIAELRGRRPHTFGLAVGIGAALVGYLVQGLTVSQYQVQVVHATFFVLAGAAAALRRWPDPAAEPPPPR